MATAEGVNPARHEIERQLERMLAHPLFQARQKQSEVFEFLVRRALDGKKCDEKDIFGQCFETEEKDYEEDSTVVRTTVSHIRNLLEKYREQDGEQDSVIITLPAPERTLLPNGKYKIVKLPPGEAYRPAFAYNPRSSIAKEFAVANYLLRGGPLQIKESFWRLHALADSNNNHPDAVLGFAEALGSQLLLGAYPEERQKFVADTLQLVSTLDTKAADEWRMHMVRGLLHTCAGEYETAGREFERALKLNRQGTIGRGPYVHFLFATGRHEEALRLFALVADEQASSPHMQALHGIFLCTAGHYEEAERALSQALALDRNCWPAHYGMTQLYIATGKQEKAQEHSKRLEALVEPAEYADMMRRLNLRGRGRER